MLMSKNSLIAMNPCRRNLSKMGAVVAPPPAPASVLSEDYRSERDPSPVASSEVSYRTSLGSDVRSTSGRRDSAR